MGTNKGTLIAFLLGFICIWIEEVKREKKDRIDKIVILGISLSIIGITIELIASFFA